MRLGAPVDQTSSPEAWIQAVQKQGYRAAYCPIDASADSTLRRAYLQAAQQADIVIAEVGAWSNPISPDEAVRQEALRKCQDQLALADEIGACCCVNIAGSRALQWDGPDPQNLTEETFDLIVETTRLILDAVKPRRTFYTLEPMPYLYPESISTYESLIRAVERPQFGVHLDPVNWVNSVERYYYNGELIREAFARLGKYIKSCHLKDIRLEPHLTLHLNEVIPGTGTLDYAALLTCAAQAPVDLPLMLEHLPMGDYPQAAAFVRQKAASLGLSL